MIGENAVHQSAESTQTIFRRPAILQKGYAYLFKSTIRSGWSALLNQGVVSLNNFLTGVIIGRLCSKDEFGLYMLGFSIVLVILDLQVSLVSTPYMVYSPHFKGSRHKLYAGSCLLHQFGLSIIVMLGLAVWGAALSFGIGPPGLVKVVWALATVVSLIMLREFVRRVSFADLRMESALLFDTCIAVIQIGGLMLIYLLGILSANSAFWVIGFSCGLVGAGWFVINRTLFTPRFNEAISDFQQNWKFCRWVFASGVLWTVSMNLYPWFLTYFHGTTSAGVWAACIGVMALINVPLIGIQNFLGPKIANVFAEGGTNALRRFVYRVSLFLLVFMTALSCSLLLVADRLLNVFYGAGYTGNGLVVFCLALGLVAASVAFSFSRALFAMERADIDFKVNFVSLFILLTLGIWLVRSLGPFGAAVGLLLANVAASAVRCVSFAVLSRPRACGT